MVAPVLYAYLDGNHTYYQDVPGPNLLKICTVCNEIGDFIGRLFKKNRKLIRYSKWWPPVSENRILIFGLQ